MLTYIYFEVSLGYSVSLSENMTLMRQIVCEIKTKSLDQEI